MIKISVVIITFNEERNLARCLDSVRNIADEVIVVDSGSTDQTAAIALHWGAKVIQHPFTGYGAQKNFATQQASNNWILSLDADEAVSAKLQQSILILKSGPGKNVYEIPRLTNYCGKWIKHCGWYPDRQTRLFDRTTGKWQETKVHESWKPDNEQGKKGLLKGDLLHYSFSTINEHLKKIEKYSELAAQTAIEKGKKVNTIKVLVYPNWRFFGNFIIKLGFLDGFYGYVICKMSAYATLIKYTKIKLYNKQKNSDQSS